MYRSAFGPEHQFDALIQLALAALREDGLELLPQRVLRGYGLQTTILQLQAFEHLQVRGEKQHQIYAQIVQRVAGVVVFQVGAAAGVEKTQGVIPAAVIQQGMQEVLLLAVQQRLQASQVGLGKALFMVVLAVGQQAPGAPVSDAAEDQQDQHQIKQHAAAQALIEGHGLHPP